MDIEVIYYRWTCLSVAAKQKRHVVQIVELFHVDIYHFQTVTQILVHEDQRLTVCPVLSH